MEAYVLQGLQNVLSVNVMEVLIVVLVWYRKRFLLSCVNPKLPL